MPTPSIGTSRAGNAPPVTSRADLESHPEAGPRELPRMLGFTDVMGILVGTVIGSGIFIVPATIAGYVQSPVLLLAVWVVGGAADLLRRARILGARRGVSPGRRHVCLPAGGVRQADGVPVRLDAVPRDRLGRHRHAVDGVRLEATCRSSPGRSRRSGTKAIAVALIAALVGRQLRRDALGRAAPERADVHQVRGDAGRVGRASSRIAKGNPAGFVDARAAPPMSAALIGGFGLALQRALWAYKGWEAVSFSAGEIQQSRAQPAARAVCRNADHHRALPRGQPGVPLRAAVRPVDRVHARRQRRDARRRASNWARRCSAWSSCSRSPARPTATS